MARPVWLSPAEASGEEEARVRQSPQIDSDALSVGDKKAQTPQKPKKGKGKRLKSTP